VLPAARTAASGRDVVGAVWRWPLMTNFGVPDYAAQVCAVDVFVTRAAPLCARRVY